MAGQRVHFIGIGGYSMSGLALWLKHQGDFVQGSDMNRSSRTERLEKAGIPVYYGHDGAHVVDADYVVYNTDVREDNPERKAAEALGITLLHRSEVLQEILSGYRTVTVSGTHGKTTTTTMIGTLLTAGGLDPTVLVGGEVPQFDGNLRIGHGAFAVAEADESDGSFLRYRPLVAVATNIEPEHLDHFENRFDALVDAFRRYLSRVPRDGLAVIGIDNAILRDMAKELAVPVVTYGFHEDADIRADDVAPGRDGTAFTVIERGAARGSAVLALPGRHNVANALAALAVARFLGVDWSRAVSALKTFHNANRRFQVLKAGPVQVVDDYAHHPTEIRATLQACRQVTPGRIIAMFQPQRYSRTQSLWNEFCHAFDLADDLFLTEIYSPPGEKPIPGVSGQALAEAVAKSRGRPVRYVPDMFEAVEPALAQLKPGDTFITMGAGNVYQVAEKVARRLA